MLRRLTMKIRKATGLCASELRVPGASATAAVSAGARAGERKLPGDVTGLR